MQPSDAADLCYALSVAGAAVRHTGFGRFCAELRTLRYSYSPSTSRVTGEDPSPLKLLPCHLLAPPPLARVESQVPCRGRARARVLARRTAWRWTEQLLSLFTYWELGRPKCAGAAYKLLGPWRVSPAQSEAALNLWDDLVPFCAACDHF